MRHLTVLTLVLEYNYGEPGSLASLGSVWLFAGDGTADLEADTAFEEHPDRWFKIIGPVDYDAAHAVHAALKNFFAHIDVQVIDKGVAD